MQEDVERTVQINRASCAREGERTDPGRRWEPNVEGTRLFGRGQKKVRRSRVNVHGRKVFFQCCSVAGIWDSKLGRLALRLSRRTSFISTFGQVVFCTSHLSPQPAQMLQSRWLDSSCRLCVRPRSADCALLTFYCISTLRLFIHKACTWYGCDLLWPLRARVASESYKLGRRPTT